MYLLHTIPGLASTVPDPQASSYISENTYPHAASFLPNAAIFILSDPPPPPGRLAGSSPEMSFALITLQSRQFFDPQTLLPTLQYQTSILKISKNCVLFQGMKIHGWKVDWDPAFIPEAWVLWYSFLNREVGRSIHVHRAWFCTTEAGPATRSLPTRDLEARSAR